MVLTLPRQIIHATVRHAFGPHPRPLHRKCPRRSSITPTGVNLCAAPNMVRSALRFSCNYFFFSGLHALGFSCRSFWHSFPLFSMVCGLFCKIPGGGVSKRFWNTIAGLLRWPFTERLDWAMVQNGRAERSTLPPEKIMPSFGGALAAR